MSIRGQGVTLAYVAWDTAANAGKTGDVANHTLRWIKDGTSSAPTNSSAEVDGTNAPGLYKVALTNAECTCDFGTLAGKSSTSGVSIMPIAVSFEQIPTDAWNSVVIETGINARQALAIIGSAVAGLTSDASSSPITFYAMALTGATTTTRIVETNNSSGTRSANTLTPPA